MRVFFAGLAVLFALGTAGCDRSVSPPPPPKDAAVAGPHDGVAYALPDGVGYAEVVNEPPVTDRAETPTSVVVYFLASDAKAPLTPSPTDVKLQIDRARKGSETLALKAEPKSGGANRFASAPGPNDVQALHGRLTAKLGGKPINILISGAR